MSFRLEPFSSEDADRLPLAFDAANDFKGGRTYVDEQGNFVSAADLDKILRSAGKVPKRVVRVVFRYRMTTDPIAMERRRLVVAIPVIGSLTGAELARVIHTAARTVHKRLKELGAETESNDG